MRKTLEVIGEDNFRKICQKYRLSENESAIIEKIISDF